MNWATKKQLNKQLQLLFKSFFLSSIFSLLMLKKNLFNLIILLYQKIKISQEKKAYI